MNHRRRGIALLGVITSSSVLSGCITSKLFEPNKYSEEVSSVLLSKDEKIIVVITKDFHYIFSATPDILAALKDPLHKSISASFGTLYIDSENSVSLKYSLSLDKSASDQDKEQALAAKFKKGISGFISFDGELKGTRYRSGGIQAPPDSVKLNRSHTIEVVAQQGTAEKAGKALLTPITVAADGVLIIGAIPLLAIFAIFMGITCRNGGCK